MDDAVLLRTYLKMMFEKEYLCPKYISLTRIVEVEKQKPH